MAFLRKSVRQRKSMLGLRFFPRIRGVLHQRIYRIDPNGDYGSLASLVSRPGQTIDAEH